MPRVIHFEIVADDPERALEFYASIFGWRAQKYEGAEDYWLILTGPENEPGIDGGLGRKPGPANSVNTISVPSVDEYLAKVLDHGGTLQMPKSAIPGIGYLAYFKDPEGNMFGMMESDPNAH